MKKSLCILLAMVATCGAPISVAMEGFCKAALELTEVTSEKAGISFARQYMYPEQVDFLKQFEVDAVTAAGLDELFGQYDIQTSFNKIYDFYERSNSRCSVVFSELGDGASDFSGIDPFIIEQLQFLESKGFNFYSRFYVFSHRNFPGLLFKIPRPGTVTINKINLIKVNLSRIWLASFINAISLKHSFKFVKAPEKRVYFSSKSFSCSRLQALVVARKIGAQDSKAVEMWVFEPEINQLYKELPALYHDICANEMHGIIYDCEGLRDLSREDFMQYVYRYYPAIYKTMPLLSKLKLWLKIG